MLKSKEYDQVIRSSARIVNIIVVSAVGPNINEAEMAARQQEYEDEVEVGRLALWPSSLCYSITKQRP